jgi:hypothetical protein
MSALDQLVASWKEERTMLARQLRSLPNTQNEKSVRNAGRAVRRYRHYARGLRPSNETAN